MKSGKPWSIKEYRRLNGLLETKTKTRIIAHKLGRTKKAIYKKRERIQFAKEQMGKDWLKMIDLRVQ